MLRNYWKFFSDYDKITIKLFQITFKMDLDIIKILRILRKRQLKVLESSWNITKISLNVSKILENKMKIGQKFEKIPFKLR